MSGRHLHFIVSTVLWIALGSAAQGQSSLQAFNVDASAWPNVTAQFYAFDASHKPNENLTPADLIVTENGIEMPVIRVSCPVPSPLKSASVVFSMDLSGSMGGSVDTNGAQSYQLARSAAMSLLDALPMPPVSVAMQTCTDVAVIEQDFTTDRASLKSILQAMQPVGGNDFGEQLLNARTGALNIVKTGSGGRAVILFTDAWWNAMSDSLIQRCKDTCAKYGIQFSAIIFTGATASPTGIKASLAEIVQASGGMLYDGVVTASQAQAIALSIERQIQGNEPCTIEWKSTKGCESIKTVQIALRADNAGFSQLQYVTPDVARSHAALSVASIDFGLVQPMTWRDTSITLSASHQAITVQSIQFSDPQMSAPGLSVPFTLQPGDKKNIAIRFSPLDSSYTFASMVVQSDACASDTVYLIGGVRNDNAAKHALRLVSPNGGEIFLINDSIDFVWTGVPPGDSVRLEFSPDGGTTWKLVVNNATHFRYRWQLPDSASDQCLARVSEVSAVLDTIIELKGHPNIPLLAGGVTGTKFSPDDSLILVNVTYDSVRLWRADNGTLRRTLVNNDGTVGGYPVTPSLYGCFSRDSRRVAVGQPVNTWDTKTGLKVGQFDQGVGAAFSPATDTVLMCVSTSSTSLWNVTNLARTHVLPVSGNVVFSPDGLKITVPTNVNTAQIWDALSGSVVKEFFGHKGAVNSARISPNGRQLVTASDDSFAKVWNTNSGLIQWTLSGHRGPVLDAIFTPDGNSVFTTSADGTAKVWDASTGWQTKSFGGQGLRISAIKLRSDAAVFASITNDSMLALWDFATGKLIRSYINDTTITAFDISNDGKRAVLGDRNGITKLWKLDADPLQQDVSDHTWSIVSPKIAAVDVDFGQVLFGSDRDSVVSGIVTNSSAVSLSMPQMLVAGFNAADFRLENGDSPPVLPAHSSRSVELRFQPLSTGVRSATLQMVIAGDTVRSQLRGIGVLPQIRVDAALVDFGAVIVDSAKDTTLTAAVTNVSSSAVTFSPAVLTGPDDTHFSFDSGGAAFTLAPKESHVMKLRFAPMAVGRVSGSISLKFAGIGSPAKIYLYGNGVPHGSSISAVDAMEFSATSCASPIADQTCSVANTGGSPLIIQSATLRGDDGACFAVITPLPDTIQPASTIALVVRCTPTHRGDIVGTLDLHSTAATDSVHSVSLHCWNDTIAFSLTASDFDLGTLCPGSAADTLCEILNTGTTKLFLHAESSGPFSITPSYFRVDTGSDLVPMTIHFSGAATDTSATLYLTDSACGLSRQFKIRAHIAMPMLVAQSAQFPGVLGGFVDSSITISNPSSETVTIDSIIFSDGQFTLPFAQTPVTISAGSSINILVRFVPQSAASVNATVHVWGSPCGVETVATLKGWTTEAASIVSMPALRADAGLRITAALNLDSSSDLDSVGAKAFHVVIRARGDVLFPLDADVGVVRLAGNEMLLIVNGVRSDTTTTLYPFHFATLVGDTDITPLAIDTFEWTDANVMNTRVDGSVQLLNSCPSSGPIKVSYSGVTGFTSISPNPASGTVEIRYTVVDAGSVRIVMQDFLGRTVATLVDGPQSAGEHSAILPGNTLPAGLFTCSLTTSGIVSRRNMVIVR